MKWFSEVKLYNYLFSKPSLVRVKLSRSLHKLNNLEANFPKIQNLKKIEGFNRFWPGSMPKVLDRCIIYLYTVLGHLR